MNSKYFIDTNIFIYSFDKRDPVKQARSVALIADALETGDGLISSQVIQEFLNVATQKFETPLTLEDSLVYLHKVLNPLWHVFPDLELFETCLQIQAETRYSFFDSQILAAAIRAGCETLFSEDLQDGQRVRSVQIVNPFKQT
jgi:predicted nucleic acid-binding protein